MLLFVTKSIKRTNISVSGESTSISGMSPSVLMHPAHALKLVYPPLRVGDYVY